MRHLRHCSLASPCFSPRRLRTLTAWAILPCLWALCLWPAAAIGAGPEDSLAPARYAQPEGGGGGGETAKEYRLVDQGQQRMFALA